MCHAKMHYPYVKMRYPARQDRRSVNPSMGGHDNKGYFVGKTLLPLASFFARDGRACRTRVKIGLKNN